MDQADEIHKLRKQADEKAEKIIPALFYEMFGDVATNHKNWGKNHDQRCVHGSQKDNIGTLRRRKNIAYIGLKNISSNTGINLISEDEAKEFKVKGNLIIFDNNNILFGQIKTLFEITGIGYRN